MKRLDIKDEEKLFVSKYMEYVYNFSPSYKQSGIDIPDCYYEYNDKNYAVEVTRYFQQNSEKKHIEDRNNLEKLISRNDFFKEVYQRLGKRKLDDLTIAFYDLEELKQMIINNMKYIENISIGNNYYFNTAKEAVNDVICIKNNKCKMTIIEFMNSVNDDMLNGQDLEIDVKTKTNSEVSFSFKYCKHKYYGSDDKKVIPCFCWSENSDELYDNIIYAIIKKNKKYVHEYEEKLKTNNIDYDYYNLVLYSEGIPAELDEEKLYNEVKKIEDIKYDEIVIFLWNEIMLIRNDTFKIYPTNK